jgi:uncharacterized LabA/DUF88 family protein
MMRVRTSKAGFFTPIPHSQRRELLSGEFRNVFGFTATACRSIFATVFAQVYDSCNIRSIVFRPLNAPNGRPTDLKTSGPSNVLWPIRFSSKDAVTREIMPAQLEKIALFIDGANLYATAKSLGFDIDYKRLLREFQSRGYLVRAFYYTAVIEDQEYSSIRPLIDWLDYNGYTVVTKATKEFVDQTGRRKVKGNMDIELAVDAMELAPHIDQMVLFSGDGDFRSLVEAVQRRGVRVIVVSTISTQPPMVADELRRQCDQFVDIVELQSKVGRDPSERPMREPREPREGREPRQHTPQFLQRAATAPRLDAEVEDEFEDD